MKQMKVGVIGAGAISDIYLKNMIHRFDALDTILGAAGVPEAGAGFRSVG